MLGGTGVDPERSFSMDWASHLLSLLVLVLASTGYQPAEEEESYGKKDGFNAINRERLVGRYFCYGSLTTVIMLSYGIA